jgi:hypothetical protein
VFGKKKSDLLTKKIEKKFGKNLAKSRNCYTTSVRHLAEQFKEQEQENLARKNEIIAEVNALSTEKVNNHGEWQNQIVKLEALRDAFFKAGRVPAEATEATWSNFKNAVRAFNATKNAFYKDIKNEQHQ